MISRRFRPFIFISNFLGVNAKDTDDNVLDGEWHEESIDIFSDPQGAVGSRPGYSHITSASIGTAVAWCGFYQFDIHAAGTTTPYFVGGGSNGKVYKYESNTYTELFSGMASSSTDVRYSFLSCNNKVLVMDGATMPVIWTGSGSAATFATSVTADFGVEWQGYPFVHSTVDPRLVYYAALRTPDGAYTSFLNFDMDEGRVTGMCKQGDDMIIGKLKSLFRVQYRGTTPLFKIYKVGAKVGPVSHFTLKELPGGMVQFLAPDFNFYLLDGDDLIPCGDNIRKYIKDGVNARLQYACSGVLFERHQYWCSFTRISGATKNDRTVVMDYDRPYQDKFGKRQYPWFIYSIGANCFAEINLSGRALLYHGGYVGKMYLDDIGTNDNGVAISSNYRSKNYSFDDPTIEKKYDDIELSYESKGDWDLAMSFIVDNNASTQKIVNQSMLAGVGLNSPRFDDGVSKFDQISFPTEANGYTRRDIMRQGKRIYMQAGTMGLDEAWNLFTYTLHAKPLGRPMRTRE